MRQKKLYSPWYHKVFHGLLAKCKNDLNCTIGRNNSNNKKCKIKEITIACFINPLSQFTETLHKIQNFLSLQRAVFLAMLGFFLWSYFLFLNSDPGVHEIMTITLYAIITTSYMFSSLFIQTLKYNKTSLNHSVPLIFLV